MLTLVASVAITIGLYDQAFKIWRTKSARDLTATLVAAVVVNELAWLNYGMALSEWPIMVISAANLPAVLIAAAGFTKYHKLV